MLLVPLTPMHHPDEEELHPLKQLQHKNDFWMNMVNSRPMLWGRCEFLLQSEFPLSATQMGINRAVRDPNETSTATQRFLQKYRSTLCVVLAKAFYDVTKKCVLLQ
ncbi:hypothetical protein Aduo_012537 [Ancylostoma duodenale]